MMTKIPLEMDNGVKVRNLSELRKNFDVGKVVEYYVEGKLKKWLDTRYYEDESKAVGLLVKEDPFLPVKMCEIFKVEYMNEQVDMRTVQRNVRIRRLKQYTDNKAIIANVDSVAFNQEELTELYDKGIEKIYLCEGKFKIPKSKRMLAHERIGDVQVEIGIGRHKNNLYTSFMLSGDEKKLSEKTFDILKEEIEDIDYDINKDVRETKKMLRSEGVVGLAEKYLEDIEMSDMRLAKFVKMIGDINYFLGDRSGPIIGTEGEVTRRNLSLSLIYDYEKLNKYGKIIMDKVAVECPLDWERRWGTSKFENNVKTRIDAAKDYVQECNSKFNMGKANKFIFWSLMILTVDKNNAEEYLSIICDFVRMFQMSDEELQDIICVIKVLYNEVYFEGTVQDQFWRAVTKIQCSSKIYL